jgi:hypothetical protein
MTVVKPESTKKTNGDINNARAIVSDIINAEEAGEGRNVTRFRKLVIVVERDFTLGSKEPGLCPKCVCWQLPAPLRLSSKASLGQLPNLVAVTPGRAFDDWPALTGPRSITVL